MEIMNWGHNKLRVLMKTNNPDESKVKSTCEDILEKVFEDYNLKVDWPLETETSSESTS
jgi:hypothetical protein